MFVLTYFALDTSGAIWSERSNIERGRKAYYVEMLIGTLVRGLPVFHTGQPITSKWGNWKVWNILKYLATHPPLRLSSISSPPQDKTTVNNLSILLKFNPTMFSSFSSFSNPFSVPRFLGGNPGTAIDLKSVDVHVVEIRQEKRARTLKHLLKLNHANHAIVYHDLQFHNHMPHVRASFRT